MTKKWIKVSDLRRLRVMEFFGVVSNIHDYIKTEDLEALKLKTAFDNNYVPSLKQLDNALIPMRQQEQTARLAELDLQRDDNLISLYNHVELFQGFPHAETAEAAVQVWFLLNNYGRGINKLPLAEETAMIDNLLQDLDKPEMQARLTAINASRWVETLRTSNTELKQLFQERNIEASTVDAGHIKQMRNAMQEALTDFCRRINALALLEGAAPYEPLADKINTEIARARQVYNERMAHLAAQKKKAENEAQGNTPGNTQGNTPGNTTLP